MQMTTKELKELNLYEKQLQKHETIAKKAGAIVFAILLGFIATCITLVVLA